MRFFAFSTLSLTAIKASTVMALCLAVSVASAQSKQPLLDPNGDLGPPRASEDQAAPRAKAPPVLFKLGDDLDSLFSQLRRTVSRDRGKRISQRIWELWQESPSRSIDLLTTWARAAMQRRQYAAAMDLLDQVTVMQPEYAEGWNQRATLHFYMQNYGKSVADIERVLALEPRHFGALAGLANIQSQLGNDEAALITWYRALEIYPAMESGQKAVITLEEKLAGRAL